MVRANNLSFVLSPSVVVGGLRHRSHICVHDSHCRTAGISHRVMWTALDTNSNQLDVEVTKASSTASSHSGFSDRAFAMAVSGEWFGYQVTFSGKTGAAQEIDERFVPEEYRNWGVSVTGFDTLTSSIVENDTLNVKFTRALPTVGCEADAIAGDVSQNKYTIQDGYGFPDGSYAIVPDLFRANDLAQKFSICLMHPDEKRLERVRIHFGRVDEGVSRVSVVVEHWDGPYCDGAILPGCGGPASSFAHEEKCNASDLSGTWNVRTVQFRYCDKRVDDTEERMGVVQEVEEIVERASTDIDGFALPRGILIVIMPKSVSTEGPIIEASWLAEAGKRSVVRGMYSKKGMLASLERSVETAVTRK